MLTNPPQELQCLDAIRSHVEAVDNLGFLKRLLCEANIPRTVLHQKDLDGVDLVAHCEGSRECWRYGNRCADPAMV